MALKNVTTGRRYRCENLKCVNCGQTWIVPLNMLTEKCVCDQTPTFIGYIEEMLPQ